jgi:hypothetical protein
VDQLELKLIDFAGALEYDGFGRSSRKNSPIVKVQQPVCSPFYAPPEVMDKRTWGKPKKVGNKIKFRIPGFSCTQKMRLFLSQILLLQILSERQNIT